MKSETTSKRVASAAAKLLRSKRASKAAKAVAASALTQVAAEAGKAQRTFPVTAEVIYELAAGLRRGAKYDHLSIVWNDKARRNLTESLPEGAPASEDAASGTWTTRNMFFDKPKRKRRKATTP